MHYMRFVKYLLEWEQTTLCCCEYGTWTREELWMSSVWTSVSPLTWSPTTSFSLNCRDIDSMVGRFSGWGIGWMVAARG